MENNLIQLLTDSKRLFSQRMLLKRRKGNHHLIAAIGTNVGSIILVNLNKIFQFYHVEENHQIYVIKNCHRCEVQVMKSVVINERNRVLLTGYSN